MILFEDKNGLCCYPANLIATITPTFPNRLRIVTADALVGYSYDVIDRTQPGFCQVSAKEAINPNAFRRIRLEKSSIWLTLDDGEVVKVTGRWVDSVRRFLGIDSYRFQPEPLTRIFLREYPFEIAGATAEVLKKNFADARALIANHIWQALDFRRQSIERGYGQTPRDFWKNPLEPTLERAGFIDASLSQDQAQELYQRQLAQMVEDCLFDYRDLGF